MKYVFSTFTLLIFLATGACNSSKDKLSTQVVNAFADNGRTVDSLRMAYQCETVTIDKWEATDVTDSTFSICLINSKKVPTMDMVTTNDVLKEIARSIKKSIKTPDRYNSFQIVFVKAEKMFWFGGKTQSHSMGGVISGNGL